MTDASFMDRYLGPHPPERNGKPSSDEWPEAQRGDAYEDPRDRIGIATGQRTGPHSAVISGEDAPQPVLISLAAVKSEPMVWLWDKWIPRAALTMLDGDPGLGKSTLALDLSARVSRGWAMPPEGGPGKADPVGVLLLSAEDDLARTIRPRLDAAGADVARVHCFDAIRTGGDERPPVLPWDLDLVESIIRDRGIALIIIDPFLAYLDGEIDAHKDQDVRRCLHALKRLAQRTGAAIILVRHLNKINHSVALYRGGGSIGIIGAVRSALLVGRDPGDASIKVLASSKSNLGPAPRSLTYRLEPAGDVARIAWIGETGLTANDILAHPDAKKKSAGEQCAAVVQEILAEKGEMKSAELEEYCRELGYSERAVKQARKALKIRPERSGLTGEWHVRLYQPGGNGQGEHLP